MNALTPHILNENERFRIASRSPINMFVPQLEDEQYVSNHTGNYWPFRTLTLREAKQNTQAATRTVNRTLKLRLDDDRPAGECFPIELYDLADEIHADQVLPMMYSGGGRDMVAVGANTYNAYDFTNQPDLLTPAPYPHSLTLATISESLSIKNRSSTAPLSTTAHMCDVALRDVAPEKLPEGGLSSLIEQAIESTSGDANIHIDKPRIDGELVQAIRSVPNSIGSVSIPRNTTSYIDVPDSASQSMLSDDGSRDLGNDQCPYVRIAAELSLLCSSYIDDSEFPRALEASVIPVGDLDVSITGAAETADQTTFESMLS